VHVKGAFLVCKYGLPAMADGGSIITSSVAGVIGAEGVYAYIAAKHAQVGLMVGEHAGLLVHVRSFWGLEAMWHAGACACTRRIAMSTSPRKAVAGPPKRAAAKAAAVDGTEPAVNRYMAAYIMGVANRLANGASNYYRTNFNLGMSEWRAMMAIGSGDEIIVRQVAEKADLDYAAASKSVRVLEQRELVTVEQTSTRGRAAIVRLTPQGTEIYRKLRNAAGKRQQRLLSAFSPEEVETLWALLRRVEQQIPHMNGT
jgi:DNA-binding MarR family transcriptional regulator